jgi:hypothetical protein
MEKAHTHVEKVTAGYQQIVPVVSESIASELSYLTNCAQQELKI